jgi:hypothetical protein
MCVVGIQLGLVMCVRLSTCLNEASFVKVNAFLTHQWSCTIWQTQKLIFIPSVKSQCTENGAVSELWCILLLFCSVWSRLLTKGLWTELKARSVLSLCEL